MRIFHTILLSLLAILLVTASVFLTLDGNLSSLTGWYHYRAGEPLFQKGSTDEIDSVTWMRIQSLHDTIECERDKNGVWWIVQPYRDRMSQEAAQAILDFTANTKLVDTLPLNHTVKWNMREFGVVTVPYTITLKVPNGDDQLSTIARYTLGSASPWQADAEDGKTLIPTTYLRTDFYGHDKRIHVVTGNILGLFRDGLTSVRDSHPLLFTPDAVQRITISTPSGPSVVISRESAEMDWVLTAPLVTAADQLKVDQLVSALGRMSALRIEDNHSKEIELPETPVCTYKLECEGKEPVELHLFESFFSERDSQQVCYATTSDRSVVFTLRATPKINRHGAYASIIQNVYQLPVLDKESRLQVLPDVVYVQELPRSLADLRSIKFIDIDPANVGTFVLRRKSKQPMDRRPFVKVDLIPGNEQGATFDSWAVTSQAGVTEADGESVQQFLTGLRDIQPVGIVADIQPQDDAQAIVSQYGLDDPTYVLLVAPRPCAYRAQIFGFDLPLVRAHEPRLFLINRYNPPEGDSMWVGIENGGSTVYQLSTKLTRLLTLDVDRWRQRNLFSFPYSSVRHLTFDFQKAQLKLDYNPDTDKWRGAMNGRDISPRINPYRAERYVRQLQRLRVRQWLPAYDEDANRALRKPVFTVKLELEITDDSDLQSVVIENPEDFSEFDATDTARIFSEDDATSQAMRNSAFAERKTIKVSRTLEIVPMPVDYEKPHFYGRIKETGELFILSYGDAQGLGTTVLDH